MTRYKVTVKVESYVTGPNGNEQLQTIEDRSQVLKISRLTDGQYEATGQKYRLSFKRDTAYEALLAYIQRLI